MTTSIKIVSDGTSRGTRILLDNGEQLKGHITKIEWSLDAGGSGLAQAVVTFAKMRVELVAEEVQPASDDLQENAQAFLLAAQKIVGSGTAYAADYAKALATLQGVSESAEALTEGFLVQQMRSQTDILVASMNNLQREMASFRREVPAVARTTA